VKERGAPKRCVKIEIDGLQDTDHPIAVFADEQTVPITSTTVAEYRKFKHRAVLPADDEADGVVPSRTKRGG
jgi:hypothetical protein